MSQVGMYVGSLSVAANPGDTQIVLSAIPTNLKPGMPIIVGVRTRLVVALTYTGGTTVPIDGSVGTNHNASATVQWDGNAEPGLTGS